MEQQQLIQKQRQTGHHRPGHGSQERDWQWSPEGSSLHFYKSVSDGQTVYIQDNLKARRAEWYRQIHMVFVLPWTITIEPFLANLAALHLNGQDRVQDALLHLVDENLNDKSGNGTFSMVYLIVMSECCLTPDTEHSFTPHRVFKHWHV
jgi:hypothetical protein